MLPLAFISPNLAQNKLAPAVQSPAYNSPNMLPITCKTSLLSKAMHQSKTCYKTPAKPAQCSLKPAPYTYKTYTQKKKNKSCI